MMGAAGKPEAKLDKEPGRTKPKLKLDKARNREVGAGRIAAQRNRPASRRKLPNPLAAHGRAGIPRSGPKSAKLS